MGAKQAKKDFEAEIAKFKNDMEAARIESEAVGVLKNIAVHRSFNNLIEAAALNKVKESKSYKAGGLTWVEFCKSIGKKQRNVDYILDDVRPLFQAFKSSFADLAGLEFNKIRLLGKAVSANIAEIEDGSLVHKDHIIPLAGQGGDSLNTALDTIFEEYKTLFDKQKDENEKLKKAHAAKLSGYRKKSEQYDDLLLQQNNPPAHIKKTFNEALKLIDQAKGVLVGIDWTGIHGNSKEQKKYDKQIHVLHAQLNKLCDVALKDIHG